MTMSALPELFSFAALDACHQQIQLHLVELATLAQRLAASGSDAEAQAQANAIEIFFSSNSREHHAEEEKNVFPPLLGDADHELAATVRNLQQEHGQMEQDWRKLAPKLRAIASGDQGFDAAGFQRDVEAFLTLSHNHLALEEILVYPASKALWAKTAAAQPQSDA